MAISPMPADYEERRKNYELTSPPDVLSALSKSDTVVLDVRREDEIQQSGKITGAGQWKTTPCTPDACPQLEMDPTQFAGVDKNAPILLYCRTGRRAIKAREILKNSGYTNVMNAGGYDDIQGMFKQQEK
jgi:phage shock protein E